MMLATAAHYTWGGKPPCGPSKAPWLTLECYGPKEYAKAEVAAILLKENLADLAFGITYDEDEKRAWLHVPDDRIPARVREAAKGVKA